MPRVLGLDEIAVRPLHDWWQTRSEMLVGEGDPLFVSQSGKPLTTSYLRQLLPGLARRAGIARRVHPHILRHTFAFEDGVIVRRGHSGHHIPFFGSGHPVNAVQGAQYREWLKETYPVEVEDLLVLSELNLSTDEKIQRHRLLTAEWVASLP